MVGKRHLIDEEDMKKAALAAASLELFKKFACTSSKSPTKEKPKENEKSQSEKHLNCFTPEKNIFSR